MTTTQRRKKFTPEQREKILQEWENSNMGAREFAQNVGIHSAMLYKWRKDKKDAPKLLLEKPLEITDRSTTHQEKRFKINYCPCCGLDLKVIGAAFSILEE